MLYNKLITSWQIVQLVGTLIWHQGEKDGQFFIKEKELGKWHIYDWLKKKPLFFLRTKKKEKKTY